MLARLAENLFWAGRYVERAEDTARMVDVTYHGLLESPPAEVAGAWAQLLQVLHLAERYAQHHGAVRPADVIRFLVLDQGANQGCVVGCVAQARENARSARELLSTELWEAVNGFHLELVARDLDSDVATQPYQLFSLVKRRCQTIVGVAMETMPRDDALRFLTLGRLLERAEMTCRLLDVRYGQLSGGPQSFHDWVGVLKSASAFEAYRRLYRGSLDPTHVVEFLMLSHEFPRSILFCLQQVEQQLQRLAPQPEATRSRRLTGRIRAEVEYRDVQEVLAEDLHRFLDHIGQGVQRIADAAAEDFFRPAPAGDLQPIDGA